MCGIAGIITPDPSFIQQEMLQKMADTLVHRGPDGEGFWRNQDHTAAFAHRRLAVIDLTDAAAQPMHYLDRYTIVYNGEIYNYTELKKDLQKSGYMFTTASDTEVILAAYDCYHERCVQYFDGMFAFAIWDNKQQTLFMARDRLGEKPFYYHNANHAFYFASEMKALWAVEVKKTVEHKMLLNYLSLGNVQNPSNKAATFFKNIIALPPASYATLDIHTMQVQVVQYWDIDRLFCQKLSEEDIIFRLDVLLKTSVARRLRSDVPTGCSLSGGIDSSSIAWYVNAAFRNAVTKEPFKSFSAVFPGFEKDESAWSAEVAASMQFENYTVTPTAEGLVNDFEKLAWHQEEPFPSSSIYAQYKVYELAKLHQSKVLLDGQGADEIMSGYLRYLHWYIQELYGHYHLRLANREKKLLRENYPGFHWNIKNLAAAFFPAHVSLALEKREFNKIIHNHDIDASFMQCVKGREWDGIHKPIITKLNDVLYFSTMQMGLEELLRYADRNSMAHGVEVRLPYLNAELVKFMFSLPSSLKISKGYTKWPLRKLMDTKLPASIVWRKDKVGFEPPQKKWMATPVFADYLQEAKRKLVNEKILRPSVLNKKTHAQHAHDAGNHDWRYACAAHLF